MASVDREEHIGWGKWGLTTRCLCGGIEPRTTESTLLLLIMRNLAPELPLEAKMRALLYWLVGHPRL